MDLRDALGDWPPSDTNQAVGGAPWPGQPNAPSWPAQPPVHPIWGPSGHPFGNNPPARPETWDVPKHKNLPRGVFDKLLITIAGSVKPNPNMITVDFTTPGSDIAFHFNPRFNENGNRVIVRNSCINHTWGPEERQLSTFPFVPGMPFEIKILCTSREFKVAVNNSHLLEYKYRVRDLHSINTVSVYNDVTLSKFNTEMLP